MFKKSKIRTGVLLFISSYLPLFVIIIIQNIDKIINKIIASPQIALTSILVDILTYSQFYIIIFCLLVSMVVLIRIKIMINNTGQSKGDFTVTIKDVKNKNHEYIAGYLTAFILPFITVDLTSISGLLQFIFLGILIGYIYIKNEMYYINPVLNLVFHYKIYNADMVYRADDTEIVYNGILISKKSKADLINKRIGIYKATHEFFFDKE